MTAAAWFLLACAAAVLAVAKAVQIIASTDNALDVDFDTAADQAIALSLSGLDELQARRIMHGGQS